MATHDEVAHNWAHRTGRAKRGHRMFYEDETIYSHGYHFPIARFVDTSTILFTARGYSLSTSQHKSITRRAIPESITVFEVDDVHAESKAEHKRNYRAMLVGMTTAIEKAARARLHKDMHLADAEGYREAANAYSRRFKLGFRAIAETPDMKHVREAMEKARVEQMRKDRERIRDWLAGETDQAPHTRTPYVRVRGDEVQTSWGVRVPLRRALALFRLARMCRAHKHEYRPTKRQEIGGWTLDRIAADGTLRAGCHVIPYNVQAVAAKELGVAA